MIFEFRLILKPVEMTEESAIRSAVADVQKTGCVVDCAKIEGEFLAPIA